MSGGWRNVFLLTIQFSTRRAERKTETNFESCTLQKKWVLEICILIPFGSMNYNLVPVLSECTEDGHLCHIKCLGQQEVFELWWNYILSIFLLGIHFKDIQNITSRKKIKVREVVTPVPLPEKLMYGNQRSWSVWIQG